MREIALGQYYPTGSVIHRLDPRVKLVGTLVYLVSLFLVKNPLGYLFAGLFLMTVIRISRIPLKYMLKGLKGIIILLMITVVFNMFFTPGNVLFQVGFIKITDAGLKVAILMAVRLVLLIVGASLMTLATTPNALTDGMEKLMNPLKAIKVPVHEIAMMMSIALRFIPILMEETDKIMKAQTARGTDLESGNIIQRAKAMVPILVPLFVSAFRRANDLATAMESRCYSGGEGRTKMKPLIYGKIDRIAYLILVLYLAAGIAIGRLPIHFWIF